VHAGKLVDGTTSVLPVPNVAGSFASRGAMKRARRSPHKSSLQAAGCWSPAVLALGAVPGRVEPKEQMTTSACASKKTSQHCHSHATNIGLNNVETASNFAQLGVIFGR